MVWDLHILCPIMSFHRSRISSASIIQMTIITVGQYCVSNKIISPLLSIGEIRNYSQIGFSCIFNKTLFTVNKSISNKSSIWIWHFHSKCLEYLVTTCTFKQNWHYISVLRFNTLDFRNGSAIKQIFVKTTQIFLSCGINSSPSLMLSYWFCFLLQINYFHHDADIFEMFTISNNSYY